MKHFAAKDFSNWERFYRANFFNSAGGFKSCNLIGTLNKAGQENLALFFSVIHVGANPPLLGLLFRPHTVPRHTLENIRETGWFTVNSVHAAILEQAHQCSAKYNAGVSEFEATGLIPSYKNDFHAPYVKESHVQLGCKMEEEQLIKANNTIFIVGRVQEAQIDENMLQEDGFLDFSKSEGISVNALGTYYKPQLHQRMEYARPDSK